MKNLLIVDDSPIVRRKAREFMTSLGFTCREVENGQQALDECAVALPDALLLDWNMPVMDGIDCLKHLRATPATAGVKVVICTTQSELEQIEEALAAGADEYVMKPFDRDMLEGKFREIGLL